MTTEDRHEALLHAALALLGARRERMLTTDEWIEFAREVAACQERRTADYLTDEDLEEIAEQSSPAWEEAVDGPLPPPASERDQ